MDPATNPTQPAVNPSPVRGQAGPSKRPLDTRAGNQYGPPPAPERPFHSSVPSFHHIPAPAPVADRPFVVQRPPIILPQTALTEEERAEIARKKAIDEHRVLSNAIANRYKTDRVRFNGTGSWKDAVSRYERICMELVMTNKQKAAFFHYALSGDADHFYTEHLDGSDDWAAIVGAFDGRYNSYARQRGALDALRNLHLSDFLVEGRSEGQALEALAAKVEELVPQAPAGKTGDQDKLEHLHHGVTGAEWARSAINNLATTPKSYKAFFDELKTAEQHHRLEKKIGSATLRSHRSRAAPTGNNSPTNVWFTGQGRYGRDPSGRSVARTSDAKDRACYNCGETGHLANACKKPRDDVRIAEARVRDLKRKRNPKSAFKALRELYLESCAHISFLSCSGHSDQDSDDESAWGSGSESGADDAAATAQQYHNLAASAPSAATSRADPSLANALGSDSAEEGF